MRWLRHAIWPCVTDTPPGRRTRGLNAYIGDTWAERDIGVRRAVWALGVALMSLNLFFRLTRCVLTKRGWGLNAAYAYAGLWATLLVTMWMVGSPAVAAGLATWRLAELFVWYAMALLDRGHRFVLSYERSLFVLFIDVLIAVTCVGLMIRVGGANSSSFDHWLDGLSVMTLNGTPAALGDSLNAWQSAAVAVGTLVALLLVVAGLALIVGLVATRFQLGQHEYTGPVRPPWPRLSNRTRDGAPGRSERTKRPVNDSQG